jgi:4'-phosphopantetheinyl transferase
MMVACPVQWWPARLPTAGDGVFVIGIEGDGDRAVARRRIRVALREALAQLTGVAAGDIAIESVPGQAPSVSFAGVSRDHAVPGIAITHDGTLSLAAINLHGPVGIDLMQVHDIADLNILARDYLGPTVTAHLDEIAPAERAAAFARAWTERETRLKCRGLQLSEWTPESERRTAGCRCIPLVLPAGLVGTLAIP